MEKDWNELKILANKYLSSDIELSIYYYTESINILDANGNNNKNNLSILYSNRGLAYYEKENYDESIKDLTKSIELCPYYLKSHYRRALSYKKINCLSQSISDLNEIIKNGKDYEVKKAKNLLEEFQRLEIENKDNLISENKNECYVCKKVDKKKFCSKCKNVIYCSRECQLSHWPYHKLTCDRANFPSPCLGITGIQNIGNTCFLSSVIQNLSSIKPLVTYFLSDQYKAHINEVNPIGFKGIIANGFSYIIKSLYFTDKMVVNPQKFKSSIDSCIDRFIGFEQRDAAELLSFLLDSLHEDLNRVLDKPYVQMEDLSKYTVDEQALISWKIFLKRNSSQILNLFYGQFQSLLICEICDNESYTFDPFSILNLPIPDTSTTRKLKNVLFCNSSYEWFKTEISVTSTATILQVKDKLIEVLINNKIDNIPSFHQIVCTQIFGGRILKVYGDGKPVDQITEKETLAFYEVKCSKKNNRISNNLCQIRILLRTSDSQFGFPSIIDVPFSITFEELNKILINYLKLMISDENIMGFKFSYCRPAGVECNKCDKDCFGCVIPNDSQLLYEYIKDRQTIRIDYNSNKDIFPNILINTQDCYDIKLMDCMKLFCQAEILSKEDGWLCNNCKQIVRASKKIELRMTPPYLFIHFNRFHSKMLINYGGMKIESEISVPLELNLTKFLPQRMETNYKLIGIINHYGQIFFGHYTTIVRKQSRWILFDDAQVSIINEENLNDYYGSAYILLYEKV